MGELDAVNVKGSSQSAGGGGFEFIFQRNRTLGPAQFMGMELILIRPKE
jgi:hypothetical protein